MNTLKTTSIFSLLLIACVGVFFGVDLYFYANKPSEKTTEKRIFAIDQGQRLGEIAQRLAREGLVRTPSKFRLLARIRRADKHIKAGEYRLSAGMTPNEILDAFTSGRVFLHKLTIPEGYTIRQIGNLIQTSDLGSEEAFTAFATDPQFAKELGIPADTFEGYLYPETYHFPKGISEKEMIKAMVARLRKVMTPKWEERAAELGMALHQVLTLASIIEKETGSAFERPMISSVFHNRLKKKMRLESDPTVIYGISDFNGNLTRKDLRTRTPYNTYRIKGLPIGPIANPGFASIEAALYPNTSDYLYFVSKKDSTHHFSTNIKDHNKAVRKYQLKRR